MIAEHQPMPSPDQLQNADPDIHLQRLFREDVELPWYRSLIKNVRELINPPKLPPLEVTSKPVVVADIWGFYGGQKNKARLTSLGIHVSVVALLFLIGTNATVQRVVKEQVA